LTARPAQSAVFLVASLASTVGCVVREKADADAVAASCGGTCPAGTWRDEVRESRSRGTAYVDFSEGSCAWSCVAVAACPADTVPVITEDCFTCARSMPSGSLAGGSCDPEDWFVNRTDDPDGRADTVEIGGAAELDESVRFVGLSVVDTWEVPYQPRALAAYGGYLYVADHAPGEVHRLDATTGEELDAFSIGTLNAEDMAVSGSTLWVADHNIFAFDLATGALVGSDDTWEWEGSLAYDGAYLLDVSGTTVIRRDPDTLDHYDDYALDSVHVGLAEWSAGRLLGAEVLDTSPLTWRFPIHDLSEPQPHPLSAVLSIEVDAAPAHGMAVWGDRMYVTGAFDGALATQIIVLAIE
jgi:hypothetical protein